MSLRRASAVQLTATEATRALCIDFEGTATDPASFLGVFCEGDWEVSVLEEVMHLAIVEHPLGRLTPSRPVDTFRSLRARAREENRRIVAWSSRELDEIAACTDLTAAEVEWWRLNLVNALPPAKAWAKRSGVAIPVIPGTRGGSENKWSLSGFRRATGYQEISALFEPGKTASRIRTVRDQLVKHGCHAAMTPVAKAKWTKVLTHNFHDCAGLAHVVRIVFANSQ